MTITEADLSHAHSISLLSKCLDKGGYIYSDEHQISDLILQEQYYIIKQDDEIVAAMCLERTEGSYEIDSIVSSKRGYGRALIEFAVNKCKSEGIPKLWCWSLKSFEAAGFYQKMGFDECILLKKQFNGQDCYLFAKLI